MARVRFKPNRRAIKEVKKGLQKEFDRNGPIRIPIVADESEFPVRGREGGDTYIYNGPVFHRDANGAQLAWSNTVANQSQGDRIESIAPGFEDLAQALANVLDGLGSVGLSDVDRDEAAEAAAEVLNEVTQAEPNRSIVRRGVAAVRGFLSPIALGAATGAGQGAQAWAEAAIQNLPTSF